ncbi:hypothetical protein [Cupriavidus campinensis]
MAMAPNNGYAAIWQMITQAERALDARLLVAAVAMVYVGIDTMAWLALPIGKDKQGRSDFYNWVNTYLRSDPDDQYQYDGRDVYAARCAVLHQFGVVAEMHRQANPPKKFGYLDAGRHRTDGGELVLISVALLVHDFRAAIGRFMTAALADANLKARIDGRMPTLLREAAIVP